MPPIIGRSWFVLGLVCKWSQCAALLFVTDCGATGLEKKETNNLFFAASQSLFSIFCLTITVLLSSEVAHHGGDKGVEQRKGRGKLDVLFAIPSFKDTLQKSLLGTMICGFP